MCPSLYVINPHLLSCVPHCKQWVLILCHVSLVVCDEPSSCVMCPSLYVINPHLLSCVPHCMGSALILCHVSLLVCDESSSCDMCPLLHVMSPILCHVTLIVCFESSSFVMQASLHVTSPHLVSCKPHCMWWALILCHATPIACDESSSCVLWLSLYVMSCAPDLLSHAHHPSSYPTWCHTTVGPSRRHYLMYHWLWGSCLGQGEAADPAISSAEHKKEKSMLVHWMYR